MTPTPCVAAQRRWVRSNRALTGALVQVKRVLRPPQECVQLRGRLQTLQRQYIEVRHLRLPAFPATTFRLRCAPFAESTYYLAQLPGKLAALQEKTAPWVEQNRALTAQLEQLVRPAPEAGTDHAATGIPPPAALAAAQARIAQLEQQLYAAPFASHSLHHRWPSSPASSIAPLYDLPRAGRPSERRLTRCGRRLPSRTATSWL